MVSSGKNRLVPVFQRTNIYHGPPRNSGLSDKTAVLVGTSGAMNAVTSVAAPSGPSNVTVVTSTNWSGFADFLGSGPFLGNNSFVFGEWIMPFAQQGRTTCTGGWEYSSQWPGFDGYNSNDVLQAGSEADAYCNGGIKSQFYSLWFEWFPNPATRISSFPISPGDVIGVEVWYTAGATHGGAYFVDYTTGQYTTIGFNPPGGTVYQGSSVEWIVEAPTVGSSQSALINYTATPWNYAYAYSTTTGRFYEPNYAPSGTAYDLLMTSGGQTISYCNLFYEYALWCYPWGSAL